MSYTVFDIENSVALYNEDGNILQFEYAKEAVRRCGTAIAIQNGNGVLLAVERLIDNVLDTPDTILDQSFRIVAKNIAIVGVGFTPDVNRMLLHARSTTKMYALRYEREIPIEELVRLLGDTMHGFTLECGTRCCGCELILASWDPENGAKIFKVDFTGNITKWNSCAIGKASSMALTEFQNFDFEHMNVNELVQSSGQIIYKAHRMNRFKKFRYKLALIGEETGAVWQMDPQIFSEMGDTAGFDYQESLGQEDGDEDGEEQE